MRIPTPARDLTLASLGLAVTVLVLAGVLSPSLLLVSITTVAAATVSFFLARHARRTITQRDTWLRDNRPHAMRAFRVVEKAEGGGQDFLTGLLLLNPDGVELVDPRSGRTFAVTWPQIGLIIADPAPRRDRVLEAIVVAGNDDDVLLQVLTPDLDAGAAILTAWPGAAPVQLPEPEPEGSPQETTRLW